MDRISITLSTVIATAILLAQGGAVAQTGRPAPARDDLVVEIVDEGRQGRQFPVITGSDGGFMETNPGRRLPDWKQPEGAPPLTQLRLRAIMEGEAVRVSVFAVFDDSLPVDAPGPKYGPREQLVASYLVREGEAVCARELADFGVEPPLLKVLKATPRILEQPLATDGVAVSKLKAVEVLAFWPDPAAPTWYKLSLRNVTQKDIAAMQIYETNDGRRIGSSLEMRTGPGRPLIAAGGVVETQLGGGGSSGRMTPQGFVPDPSRAHTFVVGTVIFSDGTYEGEADVAARMEARDAGRRLQLGRVLSLLKAVRETPELDQTALINDLTSRVSALRIDVAASMVNGLLARFPALTGAERKTELTMKVMEGLRHGREELLNAIQEYERAGGRSRNDGDFLGWLSKIEQRYEAIVRGR